MRLTGGPTGDFEQEITIPANASTKVASIDTQALLNGAAPEDVVIQATFTAAGKTYRNNYFLVQQKMMNYPKTTLHCKIARIGTGYDVTVRSDNFARGVYLSVEGETVHFSDNFFDLMPGETTHRPRGIETERQRTRATPEIDVAGRHLLTPENISP